MSQWLMLDFVCPQHGRFESMIDRREGRPDAVACESIYTPEGLCGQLSPVVTSYAVVGRMKLGEASQGKNHESDRPPHIMDTRDLGEGMPMEEWQAKNKIKDRDRRHAENKAFLQ